MKEESKFPSAVQLVGNVIKQGLTSATGMLRGTALSTSQEKASARLKICQGCEYYKDTRCLKCGCFMQTKVHIELAACPEGKWPNDPVAVQIAETQQTNCNAQQLKKRTGTIEQHNITGRTKKI